MMLRDAYQIYDHVFQGEGGYRAKGMMVIQEETVSSADGSNRYCLTPKAATKFKDAIADYNRLNGKQWFLQRKFQITKPYELVTHESIEALFREAPDPFSKWHPFYDRYPDSGGYVVLSAVGSTRETLAAVYAGTACNTLCRSWSLHLFEKTDGQWNEVPGVTCYTMS